MLSKGENERVTRVGRGSPAGELYRRYGIPALLSKEVLEADCPPVRVRLLGEDLVAFRDSQGRVGLLAEQCSYRRASLFYGRNEDCGLNCVYHGWRYDVEGKILETPAEPANSMIKHHVQHTAYPCREANGLVFTYMGPSARMPLFPTYEWLTIPADHLHISKMINENNYLQALEGDCDSAHLYFLHRRANFLSDELDPDFLAPSFEITNTRWGVIANAVRHRPNNQKCVRDRDDGPDHGSIARAPGRK